VGRSGGDFEPDCIPREEAETEGVRENVDVDVFAVGMEGLVEAGLVMKAGKEDMEELLIVVEFVIIRCAMFGMLTDFGRDMESN